MFQRGDTAVAALLLLGAQDPQAGFRGELEHPVAVGLAHLVLAVPEEGEVVIGEPFQELARLAQIRLRYRAFLLPELLD